ncbi:SLC13 family permease [Amphritea sp. 1_MG-2023]|uniref:SLC13 family permease n=1 Tax=Amphritea sp. 1_MG-2023 TaxID=3062670 RepID=UPI0026E29701|nr:SLC13 family permease [Amphritea sp. 1_MG-2023]MDO6563145.1 SLC13 family permease [Amphritea sp. 1_MG-2023]
MNSELIFVFALLLITIGLFIWDRIRMDIVAMMVVVVLAVSGIITPAETVSGFGQSLVVMIAGLFVVGEGLFRTGVAAAVGSWIMRMGGQSEKRLLLVLIPVVAGMSAVMSSTGAVALFIPVVLSICRSAQLQPSHLLMPLSFASLIGGMMTLIGTPPNMVVSTQLQAAGFAPFGFFDFTIIGGVMLLFGTLYLVFIAPRLLPEAGVREAEHPRLKEFAERYGIEDNLHRLRVTKDSPLIGHSVSDQRLRSRFEVTVFAIRRDGRLVSSLMPVLSETIIERGDVLLAYGETEGIAALCVANGCLSMGFPDDERTRMSKEFGVAEVMLHNRSPMIGKTLSDGRFREQYNLSVIGVLRDGKPLSTGFNGLPLQFGDTLLLAGGWRYIEALDERHNFVMLETPAEMSETSARWGHAPVALLILLTMLGLMIHGTVSSLAAILLGAMAMILTGCITMNEAYKSLNASSLVLIAGMLPLALAMQKSGGLELIVSALLTTLGDSTPLLICAALFVLTSVLSQFISNTATTVLIAPISIAIAQGLGMNPEPFMMTVALAASTAFATPIASPVNTLVLVPGNYRFIDFVRVGLPLQLISMLITLLLIPIIFPF